MAHEITLYTDGSALGNPGRGGYGVVLMSGRHYRELSQGFRLTTNNRMELLAVIVGLETLKFDGCRVTVCSDSKYVVDAVDKHWLDGWVRTGFKGKKNEKTQTPAERLEYLSAHLTEIGEIALFEGQKEVVHLAEMSTKMFDGFTDLFQKPDRGFVAVMSADMRAEYIKLLAFCFSILIKLVQPCYKSLKCGWTVKLYLNILRQI